MQDISYILLELDHVVNKLKMDKSNLVIVGSVASLVHGVRSEVNDIDIFIGNTNMDILLLNDDVKFHSLESCNEFNATLGYRCNAVDMVYFIDIDKYPSFIHCGYKVLTKLGLLQYRLDLFREKDYSDIVALKSEWSKLDNFDKLEGLIL